MSILPSCFYSISVFFAHPHLRMSLGIICQKVTAWVCGIFLEMLHKAYVQTNEVPFRLLKVKKLSF